MKYGQERRCRKERRRRAMVTGSLALLYSVAIPVDSFPQISPLQREYVLSNGFLEYARFINAGTGINGVSGSCASISRMGRVRHRPNDSPVQQSVLRANVADIEGIPSPITSGTPVIDEGEEICRRLGLIAHSVVAGGQDVCVRVATLQDYRGIADLRFNVFAPYHPSLRYRFRDRSSVLMAERRRRGAFCLVAEMEGEPAGSEMGLVQDRVLGTLECSKHEFIGTALDPGDTISRIYLTEVAVREDCRRMGIGTYLLNFVDDVALKLGASEVFLHVNELNNQALNLYSKCGYIEASGRPEYAAFTSSLGLGGSGFSGQKHYLLRKAVGSVGTGPGGEGVGNVPTHAA